MKESLFLKECFTHLLASLFVQIAEFCDPWFKFTKRQDNKNQFCRDWIFRVVLFFFKLLSETKSSIWQMRRTFPLYHKLLIDTLK